MKYDTTIHGSKSLASTVWTGQSQYNIGYRILVLWLVNSNNASQRFRTASGIIFQKSTKKFTQKFKWLSPWKTGFSTFEQLFWTMNIKVSDGTSKHRLFYAVYLYIFDTEGWTVLVNALPCSRKITVLVLQAIWRSFRGRYDLERKRFEGRRDSLAD